MRHGSCLLFFKDRFMYLLFINLPEYCARICAIKLSDFTDWFRTVSRLYIIFFGHSGLCLEKHANWFLGEVIELLLYADYSLSIDQRRLFNLFHHN